MWSLPRSVSRNFDSSGVQASDSVSSVSVVCARFCSELDPGAGSSFTSVLELFGDASDCKEKIFTQTILVDKSPINT